VGQPIWAGIGGWLVLGAGIVGAWVLVRMLTVLARHARQGQRVAARLNWVVPPEEPARNRSGLDRQLDTVISGYRASHALAARVAELEGQRPATPPGPEPESDRDRAALLPVAGPPPRARQLSEASFVAGSDALVRVRTAIRLVQDCRLKINGGPGDRLENGGATAHDAPPDTRPLLHDLFRALGTEIQDLTRSAQGIGGAVEAFIRAAESSAAGGAIAPGDSARGGEAEPGFSALKCRALTVELESGLQRLGAELRLLSHPFVGRSPEVGDRPERNGSDRSLVTGLRRLEGQLEEVADHLGRLTRDAEELSRELDRQPERS